MRLWRGSLSVAAIVLVAAAVASDFVIGSFWVAHPMVTAIVSALVVVLLSVAVIEAVLSRRAERRWSLLAQRAFIDLAEAAYATRRTLAEALGAAERGDAPPAQIRADLASPDKAPAIRQFVERWLAEPTHRSHMAELLVARLATARQLLAWWAVALIGSARYAGLFDQHVELYDRVDGLHRFLVNGYRTSDPRQRRARSARQFGDAGGEHEDRWFVDNLLGTITIASDLEDRTWDLALQIAPEELWDQRTTQLAAPSRGSR